MMLTVGRTNLYCASLLATYACQVSPAVGQVGENDAAPPPIRSVTSGGIDVKTGQFVKDYIDIDVGRQGGELQISLVRTMKSNASLSDIAPFNTEGPFGQGSDSNLDYRAFYQNGGYDVRLKVGRKNYYFLRDATSSTVTYSDIYKTGATLRRLSPGVSPARVPLEFIDRDGMLVRFDISGITGDAAWVPTYVAMPNGGKLVFEYDTFSSSGVSFKRLKSVTSSENRGIDLFYSGNDSLITLAQTFSLYCSGNCVKTVLAQVSYSYITKTVDFGASVGQQSKQILNTSTNTEGKVTSYTFDNRWNISSATKPDSSNLDFFNTFTLQSYAIPSECGTIEYYQATQQLDANSKLTTFSYFSNFAYESNIDVNGNTIIDEFNLSEDQRFPCGWTTLVTQPSSEVEKYRVWNLRSLPSWIEDGLGHRTIYSFDTRDRLIRVTLPSGLITKYFPGERGTYLSRESVAVPGSGLSARSTAYSYVESATYPACIDRKICNKLATITNAKGGVTEFSWSASHGGMTQRLDPPDANGNRPTLNLTYSDMTAADGAMVALLSSESQKIEPATALTTSIQYSADGRLDPIGSAQTYAGATQRTCRRFDLTGNVVSVTLPRADLSVCP